MRHLSHAANPFAMLVDPESITREVEASDRLKRLQRRVCRPLDKPLIALRPDGSSSDKEDLDAFDALVDASPEKAGDSFDD
jgi:hypothetical protein